MYNTKTLLVSIIFFYSLFAFAQKDIKIGIEIGPNIVNLRGNEIANNHRASLRMVTGFSFEYAFSENLAFKSGLFYERKGSKLKVDTTIDELDNSTINNYFDYLSIPLMVKYKIGHKLKFFINSGPFVSFLLKTTSKHDLLGSNDSTNLYKSIDIGLSAGIGIEVPINERIAFVFESRENLGLLNISNVPVISNDNIKTNSLNVLVALVYKI